RQLALLGAEPHNDVLAWNAGVQPAPVNAAIHLFDMQIAGAAYLVGVLTAASVELRAWVRPDFRRHRPLELLGHARDNKSLLFVESHHSSSGGAARPSDKPSESGEGARCAGFIRHPLSAMRGLGWLARSSPLPRSGGGVPTACGRH